MNTTEERENAFLEAIREEPEDDGLRLIFADWLEEHSDPRGQFIRTQIMLATGFEQDGKQPLTPARRAELEKTERKLLDEYGKDWEHPLRELGATAVQFRRGLAEGIDISAVDFVANAQRLFEQAPLRSLGIFSETEGQSPPPRDPGWVDDVAASPHLARLTKLDLSGNRIGNDGARALARSPYLAALTTLDLSGNYISAAGAQFLAASPHLASLTTLSLSGNHIMAAGAQFLATSPHLARLKTLSLGGNLLGNDGASALAQSPYLACLTTLNLWRNSISNDGARALAASPHLVGLKTLVLSSNRISNDGARALAASPNLTGLTTLDLRYNRIGEVLLTEISRTVHNRARGLPDH